MKRNQRTLHTRSNKRSNTSIALVCVVFVSCMIGAAYAAVPLYDLFCRVTGYGGTTQYSETIPVKPIERMITVNFDANVASGLPWEFKPVKKQMTIRMGEVAKVHYLARNNSKVKSTGIANFNVTPFEAGVYFNKLECFCFVEQSLESGGSVEMPVVFFIDPDMNNDLNLDSIKEITLSYTFFNNEKSKGLLN